MIKNLFVHDQKNFAGIYSIKYYIRGKPWVLTIDDEMLFNDAKQQLDHVQFNVDHPSLWGPLLEKAWAKIDANYINSEAGFSF